MTREHRGLVAAGICVVGTVLGGFVLTWYHLSVGDVTSAVSLRGQELCSPAGCRHYGLGSTGFYGDNAAFTLWGGLAFMLFAAAQMGLRMMRGFPAAKWTKKGYFWGVTMAGTVLTTAYLFPPDGSGELAKAAVSTTFAPLVMTIGQIAGIFAVYYAADGGYDDDVGEYKPVVVEKKKDLGPQASDLRGRETSSEVRSPKSEA